MRRILADAGPLYALVDPHDGRHLTAVSELQRLNEAGLHIVTAAPTVLETYTLVMRRLGTGTALHWLTEIRERNGLLHPSAADLEAAALHLGRYPDQDISLFDALVAVLSRRLDVAVWTYDHHFDVLGAAVWR